MRRLVFKVLQVKTGSQDHQAQMESTVVQVSPPETSIRFNPTRQADQGMSMCDVSRRKELKKILC